MTMAPTETSEDDDLIVSINVTPLVDVVLVLLVVLMVTAGFVAAKALPVDLPKGATGEAVPKTIAITIDAEGKTYVDGGPAADDELRAAMRAARRADAQTRAVVAADGHAAHRNVVRVLDMLRQEGIVRFAINVRPEELEAR
jgi:biopolymer transport protein ExbD